MELSSPTGLILVSLTRLEIEEEAKEERKKDYLLHVTKLFVNLWISYLLHIKMEENRR